MKQRVKRRGNKPPLPVITLTNVCSINNKLDELAAKVAFGCDFRMSNRLCLTETCLKNQPNPTLIGYTTIRADRDEEKSCKSVRGGLCIFVDNKWAKDFCIREKICTPDYDILNVSFRRFFFFRENSAK